MGEELQGTHDGEAREALLRELAAFGGGAPDFPRHVRDLLGRLALNEMFELVAVLTRDGSVLEVNERALALTGIRRETVLGLPLWEACRPWISAETAARVEAAVGRAAAGQFVREEADAVGLAGPDPLTLDFSLGPVPDAAGTVAFLIAEARDVTGMRLAREAARRELAAHADAVERLAEELLRRKRELETALDAMRFAREQADRASAQKSTLLRMVSHELRTPLAALVLQMDRLRRDADELAPHHRDSVLRMRSALGRLTCLVDSLLEYSRIDSGHVTVTPTRLDPAAVAAEVVQELAPLAARKALSLSTPSPGSVPPMESDPRLLRLVLFNLVQNAIKFTQAGSVTVTISTEAGRHHLAVRDTGRGIAQEDQVRVFEPFEQLEEISAKHTPGVGLGLALVREMVGALGGRITLESRAGQGSTFTVTLPTRHAAPVHAAGPALGSPPP